MYANANRTAVLAAVLSLSMSAVLFATAIVPASPGLFA